MKVKELIEFLSKLDPELPVCVSGESNVYSHEIDTMAAVYNGPHSVQYDGPKLTYRMDKYDGPFVLIGDFGDFIVYDYGDGEVK